MTEFSELKLNQKDADAIRTKLFSSLQITTEDQKKIIAENIRIFKEKTGIDITEKDVERMFWHAYFTNQCGQLFTKPTPDMVNNAFDLLCGKDTSKIDS